MGKTRRLVRKSLRNKKSRKSIRNKKGKRSIRRKSYKKMRGGYDEEVIKNFVEKFHESGLDANKYLKYNIETIENSFKDRTDFLEALEYIIEDKSNKSGIINRKARLIKKAFIEKCDNCETFTEICYDNSSRIPYNPFEGEIEQQFGSREPRSKYK